MGLIPQNSLKTNNFINKFRYALHNISPFSRDNKMINITIIRYGRDMFDTEPFYREYWPGYWLIYIVDGKGCLNYYGKEREINAGDVICLDLSHPHGISTSYNLEYFVIGIQGEAFKSVYNLVFSQNYIIHPTNQKNIHQIFVDIFKMKQADINYFDIKVVTYIFRILSELVNEQKDMGFNDINSGVMTIDKIKQYINEHLSEDISIQNMAECAGYSKYHFTRIFRSITGLTPGRYLNRIRIERAKQLLIETNLPLDYIAHKTGFKSLSAFVTSYKKLTGYTPGHFRKNINL